MSQAAQEKRPYSSPGLKAVTIIVLTVVMIVPLFAINMALSGREQRAAEAAGDVASGWGGSQTVSGPALFVPYEVERQSVVNGQPIVSHEHQQAVLLPGILSIAAQASTSTRWRGIFEVPVYSSDIHMKADFGPSALSATAFPEGAKIHWNEAYAALLISDVRGLANNVGLRVNDHTAIFQPGIWTSGRLFPGIHAPLGLSAAPKSLTLETHVDLRGSRELSLAPLGQQTTIHMRSPWKDPSFFGNFLPVDRKISDTGFDASWNVPYLARGYGQSFSNAIDAVPLLSSSLLGVRFYQPVGFYQLVERSLKYAILFVGLSLLVFFVTEIVSAQRLHLMQYTLIAAAQVLFYLLLLSFAEHIGFGWSYLAAAAATVALTGAYAVSAFDSRARAGVLAVVLGMLYALLYMILNQEDYALLIGATLLFAALAATMYATRRMDWYRMIPAQA